MVVKSLHYLSLLLLPSSSSWKALQSLYQTYTKQITSITAHCVGYEYVYTPTLIIQFLVHCAICMYLPLMFPFFSVLVALQLVAQYLHQSTQGISSHNVKLSFLRLVMSTTKSLPLLSDFNTWFHERR